MNRLAMIRAVVALCQKMEAGAIPAVSAVIAALVLKLQQILDFADAQLAPTTGATKARSDVFRALTEIAIVLGSRLRSFAKARGDHDLMARVRLTPSRFRTLRLELRVAYARMLHEALVPIVDQLADYAITPALVTEFAAKIEAASEALSTPRLPIVERRNATQRLAEVFAEIDALLEGQLDPLMQSVRKSDPEFYNRYLAARRIIERPGVREGDDNATENPAAPTAVSSNLNPEQRAA